jgi:dihydroorotate dehydrogenase subfamily 1
MADVFIEIAGVRFENPLFAASGSATNCGEKIKQIAKEGNPGGIVTKSVSVDVGQKWGRGSKQPTPLCWPWLHDKPQPGMVIVCAKGEIHTCEDWFEREMPIAKEGKVPIIASISGSHNLMEWVYLAENFTKAGAAMIELNFGTPHASQWGHGAVLLFTGVGEEIVRVVKQASGLPVMVKLPYLSGADCVKYGKMLKEVGVDGLKVCMPVAGMTIDVETGIPPMGLGSRSGIVAGPSHKPLAVYNTYVLSQATGLPIVGSGGACNAKDVIEFIMAGASGVEICTWMMLKGPELFLKINREITQWMGRKGYSKIDEFRGISLKYSGREEWSDHPYTAQVDTERCNGCGQCETVCYWAVGKAEAAVRVSPKTKKAVVDPSKCEGCGYCFSHCPRRAIGLKDWGKRLL